jgi:methyl-accepting chemotaxis protein
MTSRILIATTWKTSSGNILTSAGFLFGSFSAKSSRNDGFSLEKWKKSHYFAPPISKLKSTMKKVLAIFAVAAVFAACNNASETVTAAADSVSATIDSTASAVSNMADSAKAAIDSTASKVDSTVKAATEAVKEKVEEVKK